MLSENHFFRNFMKSRLLSTGLMVGLPRSSLEPGDILISRNDGPTQERNLGMFSFNSAGDSALNILLAPTASTMADKSIFLAAVAWPPTDS